MQPNEHTAISLFLAGDVMTGRGIDQILHHPGDPGLAEPYARDAREYVALAEDANGPVARPVDDAYVWGDALAELARAAPDLRIVNLETAVTARGTRAAKRIHYRMHPDNIGCLTAAAIDCCVLANNHVLDWGPVGLVDTLDTLDRHGLRHAGAGRDRAAAEAPALLEVPGKGRVWVYACGLESSGVERDWAAGADAPGVHWLADLSDDAVERIATRVAASKRPGDIVVLSIHWGGNWGYPVAPAERRFAHALIERAQVDVVHGHSSHHARGIEVHAGRPILYGCGDLLNDYEGISGYEEFRSELTLAYLVSLDPSGALASLAMLPYRTRRFRLERASRDDARWLCGTLDRECRALGSAVELAADGSLALRWR
jgi:poly-gamma-glutamate synthesis protein (capsule biosynthesis protein)